MTSTNIFLSLFIHFHLLIQLIREHRFTAGVTIMHAHEVAPDAAKSYKGEIYWVRQ